MNSNKWRTIQLPKQMVYDLITAHLCAMRGMSNREIVEINLSTWDNLDTIPIKIKMKEEVSLKTSRLNNTNAEMACKPQEEN